MKRILILAVVAAASSLMSSSLFAWGRLGHDAICYIAETHLTKKASQTISSYLDGASIVYHSVWMDEWRESPEYGYTTKWHVGYVDENGEPYMGRNFEGVEYKGDVCLEVTRLIEKLKNYKELDDSTVTVGIKMLIHMVGDMHCPTHIKYPGVKSFNVVFMGKKVSHHSIWDDAIIAQVHRWNYMEYGYALDRMSAKERKAIASGEPVDWYRQSAADCRVIYDWATPEQSLGKKYCMKAHGLADMQIRNAGYRLARVLNEIFG